MVLREPTVFEFDLELGYIINAYSYIINRSLITKVTKQSSTLSFNPAVLSI